MSKRVQIAYIIADYKQFGGVQTLARNTARLFSGTSSNYSVNKIGWYYREIPLPVRAFVRFSPGKIGEYAYKKIIAPHFNKQSIARSDIYHFWTIDSSLPYSLEPFIVSVHGLEILPKNLRGFRRRAYEQALQRAAAIHANSSYTRKLILNTFPAVDSRKIHTINPSALRLRENVINNKAKDGKYTIGTLTRFVGRKNVPNVIKALTILSDQYGLDFTFHLVGDAGDRKEKRKIIKNLKKSGINYQYTGKVSESYKFKKFYPNLDVFVLPSLETRNDVEGFGIVFLEANAYGVPVVASRTGGIVDAVKDNVSGLFADPINPNDIAEKIFTILTSKKNWRESSRSWAEGFSPEKTAEQFQVLYDQILK